MVTPKWTGKVADIWDKFGGASHPTIAFTHLPRNKVVLQRYYEIRNANLEAVGKRNAKGAAVKDTWDEIRENGMQNVFLLLTIAKAMSKESLKKFFIAFTQSALKKGT